MHRGIAMALTVLAIGSAGHSGASPAEETETAQVRMIEPGDGSGYWPRWRGPSGQGHVDGEGYVDRWSADGPALWRVAVPGEGNSSPIVWAGRIFLTTAYDGGRRRSILAFRRSDGAKLWETFAPEVGPERVHRKNGFASSTATTDGERVIAYLGNHGLFAVGVDGRELWHRTVGPFEAYHGTASSPLLLGDRVILVQDQQRGGSFIAAFDKATGDELWRTPRPARVGWSSPIAIRVGGRQEIVVSGQQVVQAYDPADGSELWSVRGNTYEAIPTPVVGHGLVFASSGRAGPTMAIRPGGRGDVTSSHVVWSTPKGSPFVPSTLLFGGYLYMVNDMSSVATCYRAADGELMWQGRLGNAGREGFSASPVAHGGKVFFTNDQGDTYVLRAGPSFEILAVNKLGERTLASPALVDGVWYFRTERHLLAIGEG